MKFLVESIESIISEEKTTESGITYREVPATIVFRYFESEEDADKFFAENTNIVTLISRKWID